MLSADTSLTLSSLAHELFVARACFHLLLSLKLRVSQSLTLQAVGEAPSIGLARRHQSLRRLVPLRATALQVIIIV